MAESRKETRLVSAAQSDWCSAVSPGDNKICTSKGFVCAFCVGGSMEEVIIKSVTSTMKCTTKNTCSPSLALLFQSIRCALVAISIRGRLMVRGMWGLFEGLQTSELLHVSPHQHFKQVRCLGAAVFPPEFENQQSQSEVSVLDYKYRISVSKKRKQNAPKCRFSVDYT